ncbi:MAG: SUMF1/EgtB/PvdO family nonheme iron enzyme [Anaerolineae bacterium]
MTDDPLPDDLSPDPLKHAPDILGRILETAAQLKDQFLLFGVLVLVIFIVAGIFAPQWLDAVGRGLPYTLIVLCFLAYLLGLFEPAISARLTPKEPKEKPKTPETPAETPTPSAASQPTTQTPQPTTPSDQPASHTPKPTLSPEALRDRYLRELMGKCAYLKMTTVDLKAATRQEAAELNLAAVFTDLDVYDSDERQQKGELPSQEDREPERRRPVLEALSSYPRLVLRGEAGSGKSTLVNFVTVCLAGDWLNSPDANLRRLGDAWRLPRLLPVRVVLRDYAARGLPSDQDLWAFIQTELARVETCDGALDACLPVLETYLKQRDGALLLLDGLDEVPEVHRYRLRLKAAVEQFSCDFPHCRILVTTRPYAYQDPEAYLSGFEARRLASFNEEQIKDFIPRWYAHVGAKDPALGPDNAARYAEQLVNAVEHNPRLAALAPNPLLLTLMTSLHRWREGGSLPERRQELYEQSVMLLLDLWQRPKQLFDAQGQPTSKEYDVFTELGIAQEELRRALNRVAYEAHWKQPTLVGTHDIRAGELAGALYEEADKAKIQGQQRIIDYLINRAGLLIEREQGRVYTFPHRTFQEYLAACHLTEEDYPFTLADRLREDDARWREAALLAAAKAVGGVPSSIWTLVSAFCTRDWPPAEAPVDADWYAALRAAQALIETEQHRRVPERHQYLLKRLQAWLVHVMADSALPAPERAAAGRALADLGDPRPGVLTSPPAGGIEGGRLPDLQWCYVPPGPFVMGASKTGGPVLDLQTGKPAHHPETGEQLVVPPDPRAYDDEAPAHIQDIPYGYWLARYPITNAQFEAFIKDEVYKKVEWWNWSDAALSWWKGNERTGPRDYGTPFTLSNHPVVGVTWYEAVAFSRWLTQRWRICEWLPEGWEVRLPTEAEWEKAARGGLVIPDREHRIIRSIPDLSTFNQQIFNQQISGSPRVYPWGDDPDPDCANYDQSGINTTSAVGAFPGGATPYGALDMSGNVWEWCATQWVDNYENYGKTEANGLEGDARRVVRGGAFNNNEWDARCACRHSRSPDLDDWNLGFRVVVAGGGGPIDSGL